MRYFIVTYSFIDHKGHGFGNVGFTQPKGFLNRKKVINWLVENLKCKESDIALFPPLEVTKADYADYFKED